MTPERKAAYFRPSDLLPLVSNDQGHRRASYFTGLADRLPDSEYDGWQTSVEPAAR
jgi:hypothetical protein